MSTKVLVEPSQKEKNELINPAKNTKSIEIVEETNE